MSVPRLGTCLICGAERVTTSVDLVEWLEPVAGHRFDTVERCVDRPACRVRLEAIPGERWPVADRTPPPAPKEAPSWL